MKYEKITEITSLYFFGVKIYRNIILQVYIFIIHMVVDLRE